MCHRSPTGHLRVSGPTCYTLPRCPLLWCPLLMSSLSRCNFIHVEHARHDVQPVNGPLAGEQRALNLWPPGIAGHRDERRRVPVRSRQGVIIVFLGPEAGIRCASTGPRAPGCPPPIHAACRPPRPSPPAGRCPAATGSSSSSWHSRSY